MLLDRKLVYKAIDSERNYQNNLERNALKEQAPLEHLSLIKRVVRDMEDAFYDKPGQPSMDYMRKIAGIAVRCMEQHGVANRPN